MSIVHYNTSQASYLPTKTMIQKLRKGGRSPLLLGKRLQIDRKGRRSAGLEFYYPDPNPDNVENLFNYGQSGSGKTWGMMNLIGQSYWFEKRTWVIIDSKGSYLGNNFANDEYKSELKSFKLPALGIPKKYMVVTAPEYFINGLTNQEMKMDQITHSYRIPIAMANIPILFSITKLNPKTMYSSAYDMNWKRMMARTQRKPRRVDLYNMLNEIMMGQNNTTARWYETLINKIRDAEDLTLTEDLYSPVGKAMLQSAFDHKPRWIVVTFKHADTSADSINLAIYAAVLEEVKRVTTIAKRMNFDLRVGLYVDEMQYYLREKDTPAYQQTIDAIYRWGRANRVFRVWGTQTNRHLDPLLQDDIRKYDRDGTYQKILYFTRMGGPGYCKYMDRQRENAFDLHTPYIVPVVKTPPPMFKIMEL